MQPQPLASFLHFQISWFPNHLQPSLCYVLEEWGGVRVYLCQLDKLEKWKGIQRLYGPPPSSWADDCQCHRWKYVLLGRLEPRVVVGEVMLHSGYQIIKLLAFSSPRPLGDFSCLLWLPNPPPFFLDCFLYLLPWSQWGSSPLLFWPQGTL